MTAEDQVTAYPLWKTFYSKNQWKLSWEPLKNWLNWEGEEKDNKGLAVNDEDKNMVFSLVRKAVSAVTEFHLVLPQQKHLGLQLHAKMWQGCVSFFSQSALLFQMTRKFWLDKTCNSTPLECLTTSQLASCLTQVRCLSSPRVYSCVTQIWCREFFSFLGGSEQSKNLDWASNFPNVEL